MNRRDETRALDLFGTDRDLPAAALRPVAGPQQISAFDHAAERAALASGRPLSQERAEIIAPGAVSPLIVAPDDRHDAIARAVAAFPANVLAQMAESGIRIIALRPDERYQDRSAELRRLACGVDDWPVPPAGLFVVAERTLYLRSVSPMTVVHEMGHAFDCTLGGGRAYVSGIDPRVRRAFRNARAFVTPYAACALDEYFAESVRAWLGVDDPRSPWPRATRERLLRLDPTMHDLISEFMAEAA